MQVRLSDSLETSYSFKDIIGQSPKIKFAIEQAKLAASVPVTVLLRGEVGSGKDLFAHAIHSESDRKFNKFVRVNCSSLEEYQLERELFGFEDDGNCSKGLFEETSGGTILLDEVGELTKKTQAKISHALRENVHYSSWWNKIHSGRCSNYRSK